MYNSQGYTETTLSARTLQGLVEQSERILRYIKATPLAEGQSTRKARIKRQLTTTSIKQGQPAPQSALVYEMLEETDRNEVAYWEARLKRYKVRLQEALDAHAE